MLKRDTKYHKQTDFQYQYLFRFSGHNILMGLIKLICANITVYYIPTFKEDILYIPMEK